MSWEWEIIMCTDAKGHFVRASLTQTQKWEKAGFVGRRKLADLDII